MIFTEKELIDIQVKLESTDSLKDYLNKMLIDFDGDSSKVNALKEFMKLLKISFTGDDKIALPKMGMNKILVELINHAVLTDNQDLLNALKSRIENQELNTFATVVDNIKKFVMDENYDGLAQTLSLFDNQTMYSEIKNKDGATPLFMALSQRLTDDCLRLIDLGADFNIDAFGISFLEIAVNLKSEEVCLKLIDMGLDLKEKNIYEISNFHTLITSNMAEVLKKILTSKIDTKSLDPEGKNHLMIAIMSQNQEIIEEILDSEIDVYEVDNCGNSALFYAAVLGDIETFKKILEMVDDLSKVSNLKELFEKSVGKQKFQILKELLNKKPLNDQMLIDLLEAGFMYGYPLATRVILKEIASVGDLERERKILEKVFSNPNVKKNKLYKHAGHNQNFKSRYPDIFEILRKNAVGELYSGALSDVSRMIFKGKTQIEKKEPSATDSGKKHQYSMSIYNFDGYNNQTGNGKSITFEWKGKTYPIGYSALIPKDVDFVENLLVHVYGGMNRKKLSKVGALPPQLTASKLLHKGNAWVDLYLPDFLQDAHQFDMSPELHEIIHAAINEFYKKIKVNPGGVHSFLEEKNIDKAKCFLYGASFGGRTAVRHSQLYPDTFDGYISFNGAFSLENFHDLPILSEEKDFKDRKYKYSELSCLPNIQETKQPILIAITEDDNNVNISQGLEFYKAMIANGKRDLVSLQSFGQGNPIPLSEKIHNKAHFNPADVDNYSEVIETFMKGGLSKVKEVHDFRHKRLERTAKQYNIVTESYKERFLAKASEKFYAIDNSVDKAGENAHRFVFSNDKEKWSKIWEKEYQPLLETLYQVDKLLNNPLRMKELIDYFFENDILSYEIINNAISQHIDIIMEYFSDIEVECNRDDFAGRDVIDQYKSLLKDEATSKFVQSFLLESLFKGNPALLKTHLLLEKTDKDELKSIQDEMKDEFHVIVLASRQSAKKAWQGTKDALLKEGMHEEQRARKTFTPGLGPKTNKVSVEKDQSKDKIIKPKLRKP